MTQLIIDNKEWIFSGIGVAIIIGLVKFLLSRKSGQQQSIRAGNSSTNIQTGNGASVTVLTNNKSTIAPPRTVKPLKIDDTGGIICTTWVNEGDYQEFIWGVRTIRITVLEIVKKKFHLSALGGEKDTFGAVLEISTGGGLVYGGEDCEEKGTNKYLVPQKGFQDDEPFSVYAYHIGKDYFNFLRVYIYHINPHSRQVTLNLFFADVRDIRSS